MPVTRPLPWLPPALPAGLALLALPTLLALPVLWPAPARAAGDDPLSLELGEHVVLRPELQYRPRFLVHEGRDFRPGGTTTLFSHRARLGVQARVLGWISAQIQFQDVRAWGSETDTLGDFSADGFDLHQGWVMARVPAAGMYVKVGRQEIAWDNQRLIGAVGWSDPARSFDAVVLGYDHGVGVSAQMFYAAVMDRDALAGGATGSAGQDVHLAGARVRVTPLPYLRPSLLAIFDHQGAAEQDRATFGALVDGEPVAELTYTAEGYVQLGSRTAGSTTEAIAAYMAAARAGYVLPLRASPAVTVWWEWLSGDPDPTDDRSEVFDTLYATNHGKYGFMDLFLNIPLHTGGYGLMDTGARVSVRPLQGLLIFLDYHYFRQTREDATNDVVELGHELDLLARYTFNRYLALEADFSLFIPGEAGSRRRAHPTTGATGDQVETFGYVQLDLTL